jgi:hypothetical protein
METFDASSVVCRSRDAQSLLVRVNQDLILQVSVTEGLHGLTRNGHAKLAHVHGVKKIRPVDHRVHDYFHVSPAVGVIFF